MRRRTEQFTAHDGYGQRYTIYIYTDFAPAPSAEQPDREVAGLQSLETSDGEPVECMDKGVYRTVGDGVILRSDAPNAP